MTHAPTSPSPNEPASPATPKAVYRIETKNLALRCLEPRDAELRLVAIAASFATVGPYWGWKTRPTRETMRAHVRTCRAQFDSDQNQLFGIFDAAETTLLGETMYLTHAGHHARELGVWVAGETWGRGVATEAVGAIIHSGFVHGDLKRFDYMCDVKNERSAKLARRLGFTQEGLLRGRTIPSDPTPTDCFCFSLLRAEFEAGPLAKLELRAFDAFGDHVPRLL